MRNTRLLVLGITLFASLAASAQTFEQLTFLRLNETPMSVRSAAMGAVSDDDVSTNPAAIASQKKLSFSAGGAMTSYNVSELQRITPEMWLSTRTGFDAKELSYAQLVVPVRGAVFSAYYRNDPALIGTRPLVSRGTDAPYTAIDCFVSPCGFMFGSSSAFERRDRRYGAAVAFERGAFAFGAGAELRELEERVDLLRTRFELTPDPFLLRFDRLARRTDDRAVVPNAGIRWRVHPRATLSAAYNGGAKFDRTTSVCVAENELSGCSSVMALEREDVQRIADAYRLGVSLQPIERLVLVGEVVQRNYGKLDENLTNVGTIEIRLPLQNVRELHAGAELRLSSVALRAGWWRDPARTSEPVFYPGFGLLDRVDHVTVGAGINVGRARVDVAFDDVDDPALRRASVGLTF